MTDIDAGGKLKKEEIEKVFPLTKAGLFVGRKLHEVRTGAGGCAVVIDETQM